MLQSIKIHNFKGIRDLSVDFDGKDIDIYGDNDAGKTTIYDAFLWCLFNKDSKDRTHIKWKPLDSKNNPIHGLQTSVKVILIVNGQIKEFEKIRTEREVIKRHSQEKTYEDSSKYLVNGLETSTKKIYDQEVEKVLDQEKFKNLTSVTYFLEQLSPEERREALFNYFGVKSDKEIINETKELHSLIQIMNGDSINNARAKVAQELKRINETLKHIPIKIEGIQAALPEIEGLNHDVLLEERNKLTQKKAAIENELATIRNGGNSGELLSQLRAKQEELTAAKLQFENQQNTKINDIEQGKAKIFVELNKAQELLAKEDRAVKDLELEISKSENFIKQLDKEHQKLTNEYDLIDEEVFKAEPYVKQAFDETTLICSHCQRPYEKEKQEEMKAYHEEQEQKMFEQVAAANKEKAAQFEASKESKLEAIRACGIDNNQKREENQNKLPELKEKLLTGIEACRMARGYVDKVAAELKEADKQISLLVVKSVDFSTTKKYEEINNEIIKLNEYIALGNESITIQSLEKTNEIKAVEQELAEIDAQLVKFTEHERQLAIIESFNEQERSLSERKGELVAQLVLFEEFFITKRDLLQDYINSHFSVIEWKLFDFYEDGGLNESICEPIINGVPFSGLNNGSCMQAGLDVSNTLMKQEGYMVPLFIDNAEGLTSHKREAVQVDTQVIAMYVNERDKNLRFEQHSSEKVGAK